MPREPSFAGLDDLTKEHGTARFEMRQLMPELGAESLRERRGVVDFRAASFASETQCVVDGVLYGNDGRGGWTWLELDEREIIGPIWLLALLRGATAVRPLAVTPEGSRHFDLDISFALAQRRSSRSLDAPVGRNEAELEGMGAKVLADERQLPREVEVTLPGLTVSCRYSDFGAPVSIKRPAGAVPLDGPSRLGFMAWAARSLLRRPRPRQPPRG